ncbi:3'-5' exonuclease [Akkermansiaceae bacterium]|nr:3'-5' exonuclease [Akkermansiaceae bacterium]
MNQNFVTIDFETATSSRNSACAVGIVTVRDSEIVESYYTLIQPPKNAYNYRCIEVHGILPEHTLHEQSFSEIYPEIAKRLKGQTVVAHNQSFDKSVLKACVNSFTSTCLELDLETPWECTLKIYRKKGYAPCRLSDCCDALGIELIHHQALSDAKACAELYLRR